MAEAVCKDYEASLKDLKINSKPLINMLTMLADENKEHAAHIVPLIEKRLEKAKSTEKLPIIYLVDSVVKNVKGGPYLALFSKKIVKNFSMVFAQGDEKIRTSLFKLRSTWNEYFGNDQLYALDVAVKQLDPAWPIMAMPPVSQPAVLSPTIHVNPKFIKKQKALQQPALAPPKAVQKPVVQPQQQPPPKPATAPAPAPAPAKDDVKDLQMKEQQMRSNLVAKQQELLQIHKQRLELELQQTKARLQEQALELERKNIELQRQKILQQQQQQVFAAQAQLATPAVMMPSPAVMRPSSAVAPTPAVPLAPVTPVVAPAPIATPATVVTPAPDVAQATAVAPAPTATPVASVAPRNSANQVAAAGAPKGNYNAASAGWGSTQVTPPQPGTDQAKPTFGAKRDPRTAARRDPRLARDPRLKGAAAASVQSNVVKGQPKSASGTKPVPTHPVKPVMTMEKQKQAVKPGPSTSETAQSRAVPVSGKNQQRAPVDPRLKGKTAAQQNKAVVPPVKRKEPPTADDVSQTKKEAKVEESLELIAISDDEGSPSEFRGPKREPGPATRKEGLRDGSRSPRGKPGSKGSEKRKDPEPSRGRNDRPRRSSHRSRSRSRSPPPSRRSTRYNTRSSGRRRGSDERDRVDKDRDRSRDRGGRDDRDHRDRRDLSKLGRIPKKSDTKRAEERRVDSMAPKRKSPPRDRKSPGVEGAPGKMEPGAEMASKRGRFERLDLLERFPDRGHGFEGRGRGMQPGYEGRDRPHYQGGEMVPPGQRRRRSSIDPSVVIPKELSRDKISSILAQADRQLHLGQISQEDHRKLLGQLDDLYQFQKSQEEAVDPCRHHMDRPHEGRPLLDRPPQDGPHHDRPLLDEPPIDRPLLDLPQPQRPPLDKPLLDRPPMDQPLIDRTDIYNYRLRGGIIEKGAALEEELPESDDSFFTAVARKREIQEKMAVSNVVASPPEIIEHRPEPPILEPENPFGFPIKEDVDLRMLDPNYQKMLQQKRADEEKKMVDDGPVKEDLSEPPVLSREPVPSKEVGQPQGTLISIEGVSPTDVVVPTEPFQTGKATLPEKGEIQEVGEKKNIAIRDLQGPQKHGEQVKVTDPEQPSPKTEDTSTVPQVVAISGEKEVPKDTPKDSIMISPLSPLPEDRDERLTAVVGEKIPDEEPKVEEKPAVEQSKSASAEQRDVDNEQQPAKEGEDDNMDISEDDHEDEQQTSQRTDSDERLTDTKQEGKVLESDGKGTEVAVHSDIDDRPLKEIQDLIRLGKVGITDVKEPVNVGNDVDDRKITAHEAKGVEEPAKMDDGSLTQDVDTREKPKGEGSHLKTDVDHRENVDSKDVDYRKPVTKKDIDERAAGPDMGGKGVVTRKASESDVDERIHPQLAPGTTADKSPTKDVKVGDAVERKIEEGMVEADKDPESKDVDLRVAPPPAAVSLREKDVDERKLGKEGAGTDMVIQSKDVDLRVASAGPPAASAYHATKKDVDERPKGEEHASETKDVDLRVPKQPSARATATAVKDDAQNVEMEVGDAKQDMDLRKESGGKPIEEGKDETAAEVQGIARLKRKRLNKGKGPQIRRERRRKQKLGILSQKKEEFLKSEFLKNELLKEEALKQERLKREREREEQLRLEHQREAELEAAAAEKERMLRALERKKAPPAPPSGGDDLLPAAFRDAVEPSAADQDLRDIDARRPPARDQLQRAKSWSEVPTNFFDEGGKKGPDVTKMKGDVDLRNLGQRFPMEGGRPGPPNLPPNLPPAPGPEFPPGMRGRIPHEEQFGREFQERYGPRGPAPRRMEGGPPGPRIEEGPPMLGPRGAPLRMEGRPPMSGPRAPLPHSERHRSQPLQMGPESVPEQMLTRRRTRGPKPHSREGSPFEDDPRAGGPRHRRSPPREREDRLPPRHLISRREEMEERRRYEGDHHPKDFMDVDPRFPGDRHPPRDARMEELRRPPPRGGPVRDEHSPRNSLRHFPEHGRDLPRLVPASQEDRGPPPMEEQNPYLRERDNELRRSPDRGRNQAPPMLMKELPITSMPYDPFQPAIAPQPGPMPVRIPLDGPSGPQQIVLIPPKGMEGMPLHIRMPGQPNIMLIPIRPNMERMPGPPNMERMPGPPNMQPMPGQPIIQPMPGQPIIQPMPGQPIIRPIPGQPIIRSIPGQPIIRPMPGQRMEPPIQGQIPLRPQIILGGPEPRFIVPPGMQGIPQGELPMMQGIPGGQPLPNYIPTPQPVGGQPMQVQPEPPKNEPLPESNLKSQVDINDLLKKLMTSGILTKPQSPAQEAGTPPPTTGDQDGTPQETKDGVKQDEPSGKGAKGSKKVLAKGKGKKAEKAGLKEEEEGSEEGEEETKKKEKKKEPRVGLPEELTLPQEKLVVPPLQLGSSDLKKRIPGVIHSIISGTQCASCGMRFSIEHMDDYRKHLDWHYRLNRREKDGVKSVTWRRWFYDQDEWMLYEEIDASEDGCRSSFFDQQAADSATDTDQEKGVPVTGVEEDEYCKICQEPFEQYWDEDDETWMLREAIKINGKTYHPACYGDMANSNAIYEEPSTEFRGIPGVTDDSLPGLDSVSDEVTMKQEEAGAAGNQVEEAKMKLAEILKPPVTTAEVRPEFKTETGSEVKGDSESSKTEIKVKTETGTDAGSIAKTELEAAGGGLDAGASTSGMGSEPDAPQIKSEPEDVDETEDTVHTEEVKVNSEVVGDQQPEPSDISDKTPQETLEPPGGVGAESKPDQTSVAPVSLEIPLLTEVPESLPASDPPTPGVREGVTEAVVADGGSTPTQDEIRTPTEEKKISEEIAMHLPSASAESNTTGVAAGDSEPPGVAGLEPAILGSAPWTGEGGNVAEFAPHRTEPGMAGDMMIGSGFPMDADEDDENAGFSRIFVDFIDDDDDLMPMPMGGAYVPEPYVQPPEEGASIDSQPQVMGQGIEEVGVPPSGIQSGQGEELMETTSSDHDGLQAGSQSEISTGGEGTDPVSVEPSAIVTGEESSAAAGGTLVDGGAEDPRIEVQATGESTEPAETMATAGEPLIAATGKGEQDGEQNKNTAPARKKADGPSASDTSGATGSSIPAAPEEHAEVKLCKGEEPSGVSEEGDGKVEDTGTAGESSREGDEEAPAESSS